MNSMRKLADFILFSAVFIGCCAVALCWETNRLLGLPPSHWSLYLFVFGATLLQYNLHYRFKSLQPIAAERQQWSVRNRKTQWVMMLVGGLMVAISLAWLSPRHFFILFILALLASLYSFPLLPFKRKRLKEYGLLKIFLLTLEWTLVTVWFPADQEGIDPTSYGLVFVRRFIFMLVLCLMFDLRDRIPDAQQGIRTLPVRLNINGTYLLANLLLLLFVALSAVEWFRTGNFAFFHALLLSALLTWWVIQRTKTSNSDYVYLAGIDGMMLVQAILVEIGTINTLHLNL